ncbi:MAG: proprotein convertase P-domain-containing protein, partial [Flavobacteriaceae bacterium]|nr:proprotein convertase P-domain-containing protein [Flavobacteriaceae bacterium]
KKITLLLFMLVSCLGFSQTSVAELGVVANVTRSANAGSAFSFAPCGYTQPTSGFPDAGNISDPSVFTAADDFNVAVFMNFAPESLVIPLLTSPGSSITGVEVTFYADAAGLPGAVQGVLALTAPVSQSVIGTAFGRDIVEATMDLTGVGVSLSGGVLPGGTNYWMGIRASNSLNNQDLFWELTNTITNGESSFSQDEGATWVATGSLIAGGPWDFVFSLTGDCTLPPTSMTCGNAPLPIPAVGTSGPMDPSTAAVADLGVIGVDYAFDNVTLDFVHTWGSDMTITLTSPGGTPINIVTQRGGDSGWDFSPVIVFTDASGNDVTGWGGGAPAADYQAEGGLLNAVFAGENINGNWVLDVFDAFGGDTGTLNSFCLDFTPILGSPPVIVCPANVPVNTDAGVCGATVNYTDAVAIDPDGDLVSVIQISPDPGVLGTGDVFPVGTTTVTFRATDSTGNTADCSFDIIVTDNELPVITCNDFTVSLDAAGMATVTVGDVASATDNCPTTTLLFGGLSPGSLTTSFGNNNSFRGNMFDMMAINDIVVNSFDVNAAAGTHDYEVYMKTGSYAGSETNAGDWTLVGSSVGVLSAGPGNPTALGLNMNIAVGAGDMVSFFIYNLTANDFLYINGTTEGALWASDANLEVYEGVGKGDPIFTGGTFRPRNFSGNIIYDFGTTPSASIDFSCADVGDNTVMVTATDESGNTATCMSVVTVVDDIAPVVVCIGEQLTGPNTVMDSPGIAIVDNTTFSTTINVPDNFTITDLNMVIDIEHTWTGDITLTLESPAGTQVIVFDDADGCSANDIGVTFDDESANALDCDPGGAGTGADAFPEADYIPSNSLAAFDGEDSMGVWTLFLEDDAGGDTGILNSWGIVYDFDPIVATPLQVDLDANGNATINAIDLLISVDEACGWTATVGGAPAPATLETTFVGGNGNFGNMFDINAINDITIQSFDINGDTGATFDVEVYAKTGTYVGSETDPGAWTLLGTAPGVVSNGDGVATPLNLALNYVMAAGETHAFYVTPTDFSTGGFNYTNGTTVGAVFASDANLEFLEGAGSGYPFDGTLFSPRVWNGNIIYDAGAGMATTLDFDCSNLGENIIEVTVTDDSGNVGVCFATVIVNDVTAPILMCMDVTIELDENGEAQIDPEALLAVIPSTFEVITISSDNQSGAVGNTDFTVNVTDAETVTFDWVYNTDDGAAFDSFGYLLNGTFTEVIDPAGANAQMGSESVSVAPGDVFGFRSSSVDGSFGPSTTVISNFQPGFTGQFEPANWTLTLDNSDGDAFFVEIPGGPLSFDACGITILGLDIFEVTCDDIANSPITVTVFASDSSGNLASCTSQVTVVDLLAPIVTCPADQTVDPGVGNLFWEVEDYFDLGTASATDNCTDPLTIFSQDPAPGTLLADGVYTITMSSEDEYGNIGTCTFELTVESILGVNDNGLSEGISIFPNPTDNVVTISNTTGIQLEKVAIYDVNGRLISTIDLSDMQQEKTIDVSQLATGVYMLQIQSENESTVKRLVKE